MKYQTINNTFINSLSDDLDNLLDKIESMNSEEFNLLKNSLKILFKSCNEFTETFNEFE